MVAAFNKMDGRFVIDGKLGCPVCSTSYAITDGIADLRLNATHETGDENTASTTLHPASVQESETAIRAAAMLGLTTPNSVVVLAGTETTLANSLSELTEARVMAVNPVNAVDATERVAVIRADERLPFAPGSLDAVMLDDSNAAILAHDAGRVLRQGGRLVGPASLTIDAPLRELARDDTNVVAESMGQLISLSR